MKVCSRCNLCAGSCPFYLTLGGESHSPRGKLFLSEKKIIPDLCSLCGLCQKVCPAGVNITAILRKDFLKNVKLSCPVKYPLIFDKKEQNVLFYYCSPSEKLLSDISEKIKKSRIHGIFQAGCGFASDEYEKWTGFEHFREYLEQYGKVIFFCPHGFDFWKTKLKCETAYYLEFIQKEMIPEKYFASCIARKCGYSGDFPDICCGSAGGLGLLSGEGDLKKMQDLFIITAETVSWYDCPFCLEAGQNTDSRILWEIFDLKKVKG